jgi:hypothetical protein
VPIVPPAPPNITVAVPAAVPVEVPVVEAPAAPLVVTPEMNDDANCFWRVELGEA